MQVEQAYQKYLIKVERNGTNDNIATDRGRFVILYNESSNRYVEHILQNSKGEDDIEYIQNLLVLEKEISDSVKTKTAYKFQIPEDYFFYSNVFAMCTKEKCTDRMELYKLKEENKNEYLQDEYYKPSFLWREAPYNLTSNKVNVYYDDFKVDKIYLSYYRYPNQIALINPKNPESKFNELKKIEFDDKVTDRILSICAGEFSLNNADPIFQAQKQNAITKF